MNYKELKQLAIQSEGLASSLDLKTINRDNTLSGPQKRRIIDHIDSAIANLNFTKDSINKEDK